MDGEVIEPLGLLEIFVDGFDGFELQGHNVSCLGFRNTKMGRVAVVRLTFPASAVQPAIEQARQTVESDQTSIVPPAPRISKLVN